MNPYVFWAYAVTAVALLGYAFLLRRERQRLSRGQK